jgi:hypothetical protein
VVPEACLEREMGLGLWACGGQVREWPEVLHFPPPSEGTAPRDSRSSEEETCPDLTKASVGTLPL